MTTGTLALATVDAVKTYREGLYGESDPGVSRKIALCAVLVALLWLALWSWEQYQKRRQAARTAFAKSLFGELCASHGLTAAERAALEAVATKAGLSRREAIFTTPEALHNHVGKDPSLRKLKLKLFGDWKPAEK